jgi:CheY-like chemotaxis protein
MSELLSRTIGEGIVIQTVLADDLWRTYVDPNQLENAVLNLAVNARDAMRDGGTLVLKTGNVVLDDAYAMGQGVTPGPYVVITVTDTSVGMTEEVMRRAFDPFFTTKAEGQGTGLGLSQVFGFVSQSGGHVRLQSEVGHGTTARIYLPRHLADLDAGPADPPRLSDMPRGSETVLVVEDHANVRDYVASALRHLGYDVLQAPNAERALEVLTRDGAPALLLTDIGLPGLNGRELAEQALACAPDLKVMFMTAYSRNATAAGGAHPEIGVILKPFTIDTLARKLRRVLDGDE